MRPGTILLAPVLLWASICPAPALADTVPVRERLGPAEAPVQNPHYDALVVYVISTHDEGSTNADPPRSEVRVEETLRGRGHPERLTAVWQNQPQTEDYEQTGEDPGVREEWYAQPLEGPEAGERLIVFYADEESDSTVRVQFAYEYSDHNRKVALANLAPPERTAWIQLPVALLILAAPVACLALLVLSLVRAQPAALRRRFRLAIAGLPLVALGLYAFYESGISSYTNIRVDLLLIYPALVAAFAFWPILLVLYLVSRR